MPNIAKMYKFLIISKVSHIIHDEIANHLIESLRLIEKELYDFKIIFILEYWYL
jgi:hypothetical protein